MLAKKMLAKTGFRDLEVIITAIFQCVDHIQSYVVNMIQV
ncbi:hypothetical protein O59_002464 [Cellvibrio sp. BR]|nr:hypothetical protein O59_002464 [Cellvibrio sp. BR]